MFTLEEEGVGGGKVDGIMEATKGGCVKRRTREGDPKNLADVINGSVLNRIIRMVNGVSYLWPVDGRN